MNQPAQLLVSTMVDSEITVDRDGINHINVYSKGKTELGRMLSHFDKSPFTHPYFGPFQSMEGFWYYLKSGAPYGHIQDGIEHLRQLHGYKAKQLGKTFQKHEIPFFKEDILYANCQKILQNKKLRELLCLSDLPFTHHYVIEYQDKKTGESKNHIIPVKDCDWLVEGLEDIRKCLKTKTTPSYWNECKMRYIGL